jgi:hypothetical protein
MRYLIGCVLLVLVLGGCCAAKQAPAKAPPYDILYTGKINDINISTSYVGRIKILHAKLADNKTLVLVDIFVGKVPLIFDTTTTYQITTYKWYGAYRRVNIKEMKNESQNPS